MFGSTLISALPAAERRSTTRAIASHPGAVQLEIEPTCRIAVAGGRTCATRRPSTASRRRRGRGSRSRRAVGCQTDDGEAHRLVGLDETAGVDAGELGVPAQVRREWAGAKAGEQTHGSAETAGRDGHIQRVPARTGDVLRRSALGPASAPATGMRSTTSSPSTMSIRSPGPRAKPYELAPVGRVGYGTRSPGTMGRTSIAGPAAAPEQEDPCPTRL